ncbi:hypothetical protein MAPG_06483 [Magnaporthiopsis poae ATCC 64411]|uniref:Uncharacterized protein n=1 Tax=Magnaporthiopsis poae (strain ATCC 64411 / 73-15) TaxID=644358 RepID=A0A0C4E254_MAGP6|nr:hypothetical protein MAPG_06483 [Magnaporthiopsis poae ATCC 64411]
MESTGLSHKRVIDIPFGVRAIQGGVEVDGIWISRPTTPNTRKSMAPPGLASTTTIAVTANPLLAKAQAQGGKAPSPTDAPTKMAHSTPYMPTGYNAGQPTSPGHRDPVSSLGGPPPNLNRNPSGHNRSNSQGTNEDTLSRLEGGRRQPLQTYVPKATPSTAAQLQQRLAGQKPQHRLPPQQQARQAPPPPPPKNKQKQPQRSPLRDSTSSGDSYASGVPTNEHHYDGAQRARVVSLSHYPSQGSSRVATGSSSGPGSPSANGRVVVDDGAVRAVDAEPAPDRVPAPEPERDPAAAAVAGIHPNAGADVWARRPASQQRQAAQDQRGL